MSEELKPCLCGSDKVHFGYEPFCGLTFWRVMCDTCGTQTSTFDTKEEAAKVWNTRPAEDTKDAEIERLKGELKLADSAAELTCLKLESEVKKLKAALFGIANFGKGQPFKFRTKAEYVDNFRLIQKFAKDALGTDTNVPANATDTTAVHNHRENKK